MKLLKLLNIVLIGSCLFLCLNVSVTNSQVSVENSVKIINLYIIEIFFYKHLLQLTFTPNWGKRTSTAQASVQSLLGVVGDNNNAQNNNNCNPKMESLILIYRLVQNEAQKLLECNSKQK